MVWCKTPTEPMVMVVMFPAHDAGKALALHYAKDLRDTLLAHDLAEFTAKARAITRLLNK